MGSRADSGCDSGGSRSGIVFCNSAVDALLLPEQCAGDAVPDGNGADGGWKHSGKKKVLGMGLDRSGDFSRIHDRYGFFCDGALE